MALTLKKRRKRNTIDTCRVNKNLGHQKKFQMRNTILPADEFGVVGIYPVTSDDSKLLKGIFSRNIKKLKPFTHNSSIKAVSVF
jgi:hypothetical protein